jgi:ribonuclease R
MCKHCSTQERNAMDAERSATKYKQVEYMQQFVGETFEGMISGVAAFGVFVETIEHKCEGMLPINDLLDIDRFEFSEQEYALIGRNTGIRFTIGDKIKIKVVRADLDKRQIDFHLAEMPEQRERKALPKLKKDLKSGNIKKKR